MKFNSQTCTTRSQSERLLALGLKKETADMEIHSFKDDEQETFEIGYANKGYMEPEFAEIVDCFPAWSLHRLIEMMPNEIFYEDSTLILGVFGDGVYYADNEYGEVFKSFDGNLYNCIIKCIDWLIKEGYFNKEYLEEL